MWHRATHRYICIHIYCMYLCALCVPMCVSMCVRVCVSLCVVCAWVCVRVSICIYVNLLTFSSLVFQQKLFVRLFRRLSPIHLWLSHRNNCELFVRFNCPLPAICSADKCACSADLSFPNTCYVHCAYRFGCIPGRTLSTTRRPLMKPRVHLIKGKRLDTSKDPVSLLRKLDILNFLE